MKTPGLLRYLLRSSRVTLFAMIAAGVLSGLCSVGVIALVSRALRAVGQQPLTLLALGFAAVVLGKIVTGLISQLLLTRFTQGNILDLSVTLSARLLQAPLRTLEQKGGARILATLTDDVSAVSWGIECIPRLATNVAVLLGCGVYMAWLSWQVFLSAFAVTAVGALLYRLLHKRGFKAIHAAREARAQLFAHFRTLVSGAKELIMHEGRREQFLGEQLRGAASEYRRQNLQASWAHSQTDALMQVLLYGLIGLVLFAYPAVATVSPETLTGYAFSILYMMTPLWTVIGSLPAVLRAQVALEKIHELEVSLDTAPAAKSPANHATSQSVHIRMKQVVFTYADPTGAQTGFTLGPIDWQLRSGELVFVVGGNGSGKSTFVKVLTGLYAPRSGEIVLDATRVSGANAQWYREHFAAVFSDFHLFDRLLGLDSEGMEASARRYLELLEIAHKVDLRDGVFSTTDLSQGQRKRLALVTAYLEDRPVYVFDEWAADQDPQYKHIFYSRLLPDLRARGKAVVVITHDDRYFHMGDRVVKLEEGRVAEWSSNMSTAGPMAGLVSR